MAGPDDDLYASDTDRMVRAALGGVPALPALAGDGATAAFAHHTFVGETDVYCYAVWFVPLAGGAVDVITVIDDDLAGALIDERDLDLGHEPFDPVRIAEPAATVAARLRDGGFRPLGAARVDPGTVALDGARLDHAADREGGVRVALFGDDGRELVAERFPGLDLGRCRYRPAVHGVWVDRPLTRVLLVIGHASTHSCDDIDPIARLWPVPRR